MQSCFQTKCSNCEKEISKENYAKRFEKHFCNMECYNEYKIKYNTFSGLQRKCGWKHTEEAKKKIGKRATGENHYNWKGGTKNNKEYQRNWLKKWVRENPLKWKAHCHKRRTLEKLLSIETVQRVYEDNIKKYGTLTCYLCLKPILFGKDSLEHKLPISRGGTNKYENLAVAHRSCNSKKHDKTEKEYKELA